MQTKNKELIMFGFPIKCNVCKEVFSLFGERSLTDEDVVKNLAHYHLWKLGVRMHQADCANKQTTRLLGGIYPC